MEYCNYCGHEGQTRGVEEHRLVGGRGDGMRLFEVRNGLGLEVTVAADRCADLYRVRFMGRNMGFFSPCGYVAPAYYDKDGDGFLKSFTTGFLTTCGLSAAGAPCEDDGESLPLHGTIGNTPADHIYWDETEDALRVHATVREARIFQRKLILRRTLTFSCRENLLTISDAVENHGDAPSPLMLLYHMNMGYPLLSERAEVVIPSKTVTPRNAHAAEDLDTHLKMLPPQPGFEEQCYYHSFEGTGRAMIFNPDIGLGLEISFDTSVLDHFCEWKMMGVHDYVLGLEPGNCICDGRKAVREAGELKWIAPGERKEFAVQVRFLAGPDEWNACKEGTR